ncbi:unnamed protein product [Moneuplotes crassus]|uniref:Uncharacterized protein n=1 Tax=Euplotes crassus TaxID=5936 RepID=A0AAD1XLV6_EUPCR|nr:unnamed protein product [Moneuplotes crassus]
MGSCNVNRVSNSFIQSLVILTTSTRLIASIMRRIPSFSGSLNPDLVYFEEMCSLT